MKKVLCHGVFDVLHAGHLAYFKAAKKFGDYLVVSVTTDQYVNKGPGRPYFTTNLRAEMVKALGVVDEVIISSSPTAVSVIEQVKPNFYVKGPDYKDLTKDVTGEIYNEQRAVEKHGGQLVFVDEETYSSSTIINRHFQPWTDDQQRTISAVRDLGGIEAIERAIDNLGRLKVLVIGEPILDIYRFVTPDGISSKSPSISARFQYEETYLGGSIAIQNHLLGFTECCTLQPGSTQKKIRYISGTQRVFEVTEIQERHNHEFIADKILELSADADVIVAADFGHGLFENQVLDVMDETNAFIGLNVQTNSSNYGFNMYTKHKRYDYLCLDTREARLAEHDRTSPPLELAKRIHSKGDALLSVTLGPSGSVLLASNGMHACPAFADGVVDAIGAGDSYFAITSVLLASGCNPGLVPFIGNVFAGLKCQIIGNKSAVSKASLLKACRAILS